MLGGILLGVQPASTDNLTYHVFGVTDVKCIWWWLMPGSKLHYNIDKSQVNKLQSILQVAARSWWEKESLNLSRMTSETSSTGFHPTEDQVQDWCSGLQVPPWNSPTIPIGDAQRSRGHRWSTIPPICRAWGPRCSTFQNCRIRLPNVRCFGSHFLELVDEWTQKFQSNWTCF